MSKTSMKRIGWLGRLALVFLAVTVFIPAKGYCQMETVALLLEQTPRNGGVVTPDVGVHSLAPNSEIRLSAVPKSGYRFVYWLGDVVDPTSSSTITHIDSPKIIIAVFARSEYQNLAQIDMIKSSPYERLISSPQDYSNTQYTGGGGQRPKKPHWNPHYPKHEDSPLPVPGEGDDPFPVPGEEIPEPATALIMAAGALWAKKLFERRIKK